MEFAYIKRTDIENNLCNISQIVFEVTSMCNLRCYYCAYGNLYHKQDEVNEVNMPFEKAKLLIDYFVDIWKNNPTNSYERKITISFYGGEPLLNFGLIKDIISYVERIQIKGVRFEFSMTTNGLLLDRYIAFLVRKEVHLLVSIDGDKRGHSYRVRADGSNSFDTVFKNIEDIKTRYPDYFDKCVNFNSVIHDRNGVIETFNFLKYKFGKDTTLSSLSTSNIRRDKIEEFEKIYKEIDKYLGEYLANSNEQNSSLIYNFPIIFELLTFIFNTSGNVYKNYNELLVDVIPRRYPSGTCTPFSKKIFLTTEGKILVCERISQKYMVGIISKSRVEIDVESIVQIYNQYYKKIEKQCRTCYNNTICLQCMFQMDSFMNEGKCNAWIGQEEYNNLQRNFKLLLVKVPGLYRKIMNEILVS